MRPGETRKNLTRDQSLLKLIRIVWHAIGAIPGKAKSLIFRVGTQSNACITIVRVWVGNS